MDPYYSNYPSTCSWNTPSPPVASLGYESNSSSFSSFNDLSYPFDQPPVDPNVLGNQNTFPPPVFPSVYESDRTPLSPLNGLSSPLAQPPMNANVLGNQNSYNYPTTSEIQCLWETNGIICNHWCCSPEELAAHIHSIHMSTKEMKVCHWKSCDRQGKMFRARCKLADHVRVHTGEAPFGCDVCGRRFARAENRKIHLRTHTGEKPFLCPEYGCPKRFACSADLIKHKKTHLEPTPYPCKKCDRKYGSPSSLRRHMKNHHNEKSSEASDSGESSTSASSVSEIPAPAYYNNQAYIPNHPQVEHSDFYYNRYQYDHY